jgi:hypothetical protein
MKTETYNAIAFLDLETSGDPNDGLSPLGNQIAEAFEKGNYQRLGYLYAQALNEQIKLNQARQTQFYKKAFAEAGVQA